MSRTRQRPGNIVYNSAETGFRDQNYPVISENFVETFYPGSTPCSHSSTGYGSAFWVFPSFYPPNVRGRTGTMVGHFQPANLGFPSYVTEEYELAQQEHVNTLNWRKLDSSASASLIQTLAELDETLLMFTKRFWTQLNYGAFTWGIVPFVQDVTNWAHSARKAFDQINGESKHTYRAKTSFGMTYSMPPKNNFALDVTVQTTFARSGSYALSGLQDSLQWLDRLGFHPDVATAYDLVPFSFVLDYFLPIGDFLTSTFQRGWVNQIAFNGWLSVKREFKFSYSNPGTHWVNCGGKGTIETFERFNDSSVLHTEPVRFDIPDFSRPTMLQIFNTQYLAWQRYGKRLIKR